MVSMIFSRTDTPGIHGHTRDCTGTNGTGRLSEGDIVVGQFGWADHGVAKGHALSKVPQGVPMTLSLGALGMPGFTGWYGLTEIGQPKEGEVLVVAAARSVHGGVGECWCRACSVLRCCWWVLQGIAFVVQLLVLLLLLLLLR